MKMKKILSFVTAALLAVGITAVSPQVTAEVTVGDTIQLRHSSNIIYAYPDGSFVFTVVYNGVALDINNESDAKFITENIRFTSSDESIATVDSLGRVTAHSDGKVEIWAADNNGNSCSNKIDATTSDYFLFVSNFIHVNGVTKEEQEKELERKITACYYIHDSNYLDLGFAYDRGYGLDLDVTLDKAADENSDSTAICKVSLKSIYADTPIENEVVLEKDTVSVQVRYKKLNTEIFKGYGYGLGEDNVTYVNYSPDTVYVGYFPEFYVDKELCEIYESMWKNSDPISMESLIASVKDSIGEREIYLKGINPDGTPAQSKSCGKIGNAIIDYDFSNLEYENGEYTVYATVNMNEFRSAGREIYISENETLTLGDSDNNSTAIEKIPFKVIINIPDYTDNDSDKDPDKDNSDNPDSDKDPDKDNGDKPDSDKDPDKDNSDNPDSDKDPDKDNGDKPDSDKDPDKDNDKNPDPTPSPAPPSAPSGTSAVQGNMGPAVTGASAVSALAMAKPGDRITVAMTSNDDPNKILKRVAYKRNVTVDLRYSGYTISVNSDDLQDDFSLTGIYSTGRFLTAADRSELAGAKEIRQIRVKNFTGVDKLTVTVTMRGGSKGLGAAALNRTAKGKFKEIAEGTVADDMTFSFEITAPGNYVVYAGNLQK